jgi:hypothetical protein
MSATVVVVFGMVLVVHLLLTVGLIARVRTLQELVTGGARETLPRVGTRLTPFSIVAQDGSSVSDASLAEETTLVGFFTADCPWCEKALDALLKQPPKIPMVSFVVGAGDEPKPQALAESLRKLGRVAYTTAGDAVHATFRPPAFPSLYRVEVGSFAAVGHAVSDVIR